MRTAVSAPGKVFLAGGYLVLDRAYTGLIFGIDARMHVIVEDIDTPSGVELAEIDVRSPQFLGAAWNYGYHQLPHNDGGMDVLQLQGSPSATLSRSLFIETTLAYALSYIASVLPGQAIKPTTVRILADDDYYSSDGVSQPESGTEPRQRFGKFNSRIQDTHKTGLGSSAALVTALTGAVLAHYLSSALFDLKRVRDAAILHNLAQAAHCAAQGKVGSGFDVAAAVYGTLVYRRFSPSILESLGEVGSNGFATRLQTTVEGGTIDCQWDTEIKKEGVSIPEGMALVLCDVRCGSQTVGMVKQVLTWRESHPSQSTVLFDALHEHNQQLAAILSDQSSIDTLPDVLKLIRAKIREIGSSAGVPIEPPEQTKLLDALTCPEQGLYGGVVPGAGGYDAIALLIRDNEATRQRIRDTLANWNATTQQTVKLLPVKGELEGIRLEDVALYDAV